MRTVTLASFTDNVQAHILQDILKEEGIESILQGELSTQVLSYIHGIDTRILVFEKDLERAKAVLKEAFPQQTTNI